MAGLAASAEVLTLATGRKITETEPIENGFDFRDEARAVVPSMAPDRRSLDQKEVNHARYGLEGLSKFRTCIVSGAAVSRRRARKLFISTCSIGRTRRA